MLKNFKRDIYYNLLDLLKQTLENGIEKIPYYEFIYELSVGTGI